MAMQVSLPQPRRREVLHADLRAIEPQRSAARAVGIAAAADPADAVAGGERPGAGQKDSRVERLLDTYKDNGRVVDELFLATLSRPPSGAEKQLARGRWTKIAWKARRICNGRWSTRLSSFLTTTGRLYEYSKHW